MKWWQNALDYLLNKVHFKGPMKCALNALENYTNVLLLMNE